MSKDEAKSGWHKLLSYATGPRERKLKPLDYLVFNEAIEGLGLTEATCTAWGAGYAPKGIMRGRLAIPIHDRAGTLLAYVGVALTEETSQRPRSQAAVGSAP